MSMKPQYKVLVCFGCLAVSATCLFTFFRRPPQLEGISGFTSDSNNECILMPCLEPKFGNKFVLVMVESNGVYLGQTRLPDEHPGVSIEEFARLNKIRSVCIGISPTVAWKDVVKLVADIPKVQIREVTIHSRPFDSGYRGDSIQSWDNW